MPTFVLSDESINTYGFRVKTKGLNLSRFKANPVMLADHFNSLNSVLGRWGNIRIEDDNLKADAEFDEADPEAAKVKGKVDRGFVKGASIGLLFEPSALKKQPDGVWDLEAAEILEASICAVPSNGAALKLYVQENGELKQLSHEEVKLSLSALNNQSFINQKSDMKKIILSMAALTALNLVDHNTTEGVDTTLVDRAIDKLTGELKTAKTDLAAKETALNAANTALENMKKEKEARLKAEAETAVQTAIDEGRIDATANEQWVNLMLSNPELAKATLSAIPAKQVLSNQVNNPAQGAAAAMTEEAFMALSAEAQLEYKTNNPEAYKKLFA